VIIYPFHLGLKNYSQLVFSPACPLPIGLLSPPIGTCCHTAGLVIEYLRAISPSSPYDSCLGSSFIEPSGEQIVTLGSASLTHDAQILPCISDEGIDGLLMGISTSLLPQDTGQVTSVSLCSSITIDLKDQQVMK